MARILVVDDEPTVAKLIKSWLTLSCEPHDVVTVDTAADALELLESSPFELVIVDLFMPDMDGLETIMAIRRDHPTLKVVAMSAGGPEVLDPARLLGASWTLRKPFRPGDLVAAVDGTLGAR